MPRLASRLLVAALCAAGSWGFSPPPALAGVWPTEVDRVARQLDATDPGERRAAAGRLLELPVHLAAPLIEHALADPDVDVRLAAAAAALAHRMSADDVVIGWLNEPDARLRLAACQLLRAAPAPKATTALARVLGDADARVRQAAAAALGNTGSVDAVVALLGHLDDPSPEARAAVVDALWRLGDARAVVPLVGKIQDSVPEVRRAVARALGELGDARAATALILALRDTVTDVRVDALSALGNLGDAGTVLAVAPMVDPQVPPEVRRAALSALGKIGGPKALGILIASLDRDEPGSARAPARDALVRMGPAAVPALLAVLAAPTSERAAAFAAEALGMLRAPGARDPILLSLRKGVLPAVHALRALDSLGDEAALPVVLELLADRSAAVRAEARRTADALLSSPSPKGHAVDPIAAALADAHAPVDERAQLARLLGRTRAPRAARILAPLVGSRVLQLRLAAIDALGALGPSGEDPALLAALDDENPVVRVHAAGSLGRAASEPTVLALLDRISSAQQQDRAALATAAAGILALSRSDGPSRKAAGLLVAVEGSMRDALVEGLGRAGTDSARTALDALARSTEPGDRRKAAEALAGQPGGRASLRSLLGDYDAGVRANAVWALGQNGEAADLAALASLLSDPSSAVAANAGVSVGRLAGRSNAVDEAKKALCPALLDARSYVRVGALTGLTLVHARCGADGDPERALLSQDPAPLARAAAAELLFRVPAAADRDRRALSRCRLEDPFGSVAARCAAPLAAPGGTEPVSVLVVPDGLSRAAPELPFALAFADGTIRHGVTDRRGGVFEQGAPRGSVNLEVAAAFSR